MMAGAACRALLGMAALALAGRAMAAEGQPESGGEVRSPWEFSLTAYPTIVRGGDSYTSAVATADRGPLHFEARYNYEAVGARSAFVGWNFSGGQGDGFQWELTPLIGGAWGAISAVVPGLKGSVAYGRVDFYTEIEYVRFEDRDSRYLYAWSELGFKAASWLRLGVATQRTRAYGGERDLLAGPFAQVSWERLTLGAYWFQPASQDQVVVMAVGVSF
ncbi:hypothetical protein QTH91_08530 [Variovorax dokdonensis]|uniref:Uncharacterized protein n=1 Tax=Variovorax dokdonensis TaxID=344883 RepID=A0ABT7N995_9BURK|nr:hypothetical protein [Variovorax dokdonensis]MDM0044522.1 hypothetical protein [Variovorax dokdonensis]